MILSRLLEVPRRHNPLGYAAWPLLADPLGQNELLGTAAIFIQFAVTHLQLQLRLRTINQRDKLLFAFRPFGRLPWPLILFPATSCPKRGQNLGVFLGAKEKKPLQ